MRYILDDNGYIKICSETNITCENKTCTAYTGTVPAGYDSLLDWHTKEIERLNAWKIVDGNLVFDEYEWEYISINREEEIKEGLIGKSIVQMTLNNDITDFNTGYNHFHPFGSSGDNTVIGIGKKIQYGFLTSVDYGDRTAQKVCGVMVAADGVDYVKVSPTIRYLNNSTSKATINTTIRVTRGSETKLVKNISETVPSSARYTASFTYLVGSFGKDSDGNKLPLQYGDFIFISSYKSVDDVDVISSDNDTSVLFETLC